SSASYLASFTIFATLGNINNLTKVFNTYFVSHNYFTFPATLVKNFFKKLIKIKAIITTKAIIPQFFQLPKLGLLISLLYKAAVFTGSLIAPRSGGFIPSTTSKIFLV